MQYDNTVIMSLLRLGKSPTTSIPGIRIIDIANIFAWMQDGGVLGPAKRSWGGVKQVKDGVRSHVGGESTEKRSVIYVTAKIQESRMHQHQMEKVDAHGKYAMFGEDDINFDLKLEKFGVDTSILKEPAVQHIFCVWVEDWEVETRKKNDCVSETLLL